MNKKIVYIIAVAAFALLLVGAFVGYDRLKTTYEQTEGETIDEMTVTPLQTKDFTVTTASGEKVSLSSLQGKPIVVNFWATWCTYCVQEMDAFEEMAKKYGDRVCFMMVNTDDSVRSAEYFLQAKGYTFPVYYDTENEAVMAYSVRAIPRTLFIDAQGRLLQDRPGMMAASQLEMYIQSYFGVS